MAKTTPWWPYPRDAASQPEQQVLRATGTDTLTPLPPPQTGRTGNGGIKAEPRKAVLDGARPYPAANAVSATKDTPQYAPRGELGGKPTGTNEVLRATMDRSTTSGNDGAQHAENPINIEKNRMSIDCPGRDSNPHDLYRSQDFKS